MQSDPPKTTYEEPLRHTYLDTKIDDLHHKAIINTLLQTVHCKAGDHIVEIGAGSGRYTEMLLEEGLSVTAIEPDPLLAEKLEQRLGHHEKLSVVIGSAYDTNAYPESTCAACGFHVLHHIDDGGIQELGKAFKALFKRAPFQGWFFLEPNPWNPLYPIQFLATPAIQFAEEKSIWRRNNDELFDQESKTTTLGAIGYFPPRPFVATLPENIQLKGTTLKKRVFPFKAYKVFGVTKPSLNL